MVLKLTTIAITLLVSSAALAEPKVITLDNCSKVELDQQTNITNGGSRTSISVKCIGEDVGPKIREKYSGGIILQDFSNSITYK